MGPKVQDSGGTLAKSPDITQVLTWLAGCIFAWDGGGKTLKSVLPGAVEIPRPAVFSSFCDHIPCLQRCFSNSATSEQVAQ